MACPNLKGSPRKARPVNPAGSASSPLQAARYAAPDRRFWRNICLNDLRPSALFDHAGSCDQQLAPARGDQVVLNFHCQDFVIGVQKRQGCVSGRRAPDRNGQPGMCEPLWLAEALQNRRMELCMAVMRLCKRRPQTLHRCL
jgi:hypothetical protein